MTGTGLARFGWRNLWRNPRRTILTLVAISFGLFLAVMFTALQDRSFADMIDVAARMGGGHVVVQHPDYLDTPSLARTVDASPAFLEKVRAVPHVERVIPRVSGPTMLASAGQSYGAFFMAIDPAQEDEDSLSWLAAVGDGQMLPSAEGNGILLGERLARNLKVDLGDKVVYTMLDKNGEIASGLARVSGIVRTNVPSLDGALAILPLQTVRTALSYGPTDVTQIAVFLDDSRQSTPVGRGIDALGEPGAKAYTWFEAQPDLSGFIAMKVGGARFMEGVILILVAASIFNTLFVSVIERTREFGVMLAIGWSPGQVFGLVMWESLWLALVGVVAGAAVTWFPYSYLTEHPIDVSAQFAQGAPMEVAGVGVSPFLHIGIFPEHAAIIVLAVVGSTLVAGLYPAWRAGRTVPVDSIKLV